jgi:hypothetical protein
MEKAHELNPKGNTAVVFHASNGMPGSIYAVDKTKKVGDKDRLYIQKDFAINRETGQPVPLKRESKYHPLHPEDISGGGTPQDTEEQLVSINATEWENKMTELAQFNKHADEVIGSAPLYLGNYEQAKAVSTKEGITFVDYTTNQQLPDMSPQEKISYEKMHDADIFLENVRMNFSGAFNKAYEYGSPEQKEALTDLSKRYADKMNPMMGESQVQVWQPVRKKEILRKAIEELNIITKRVGPSPELFQRTHDYALDKSSETFSNVALESYDQFKQNMPVIAIENWAPGMAFNRAEDLKALVEETKKKFAEKLHKEGHVSLSRAKKIAEKQIGATWDVGHVNLQKKHGWTDEDIIRETETIAKNVKHLHLTDNFGHSDSHLVPGMGNVPFKEHLEKLEKAGVLDKIRKVVEAGGYIKDISQKGAHGETMSAFGSGIYGAKMAPYWNQAQGMMGSYFGGYGNTNPPTHHNVYGAGFTTLPTELGGTIPGGGSRFSGNPTA